MIITQSTFNFDSLEEISDCLGGVDYAQFELCSTRTLLACQQVKELAEMESREKEI